MCIHQGERGVKRAAAAHLAHKLTEEQEFGLEHFTQRGSSIWVKAGEVYTYSGVVALALQEEQLGGVIVAAPAVDKRGRPYFHIGLRCHR